LAYTALAAVARIRSGTRVAQRSLPIRASADDIRRSWDDPAGRAAVLNEMEVVDGSLELRDEAGDWGTIAVVGLVLETSMPQMAAQTLAGKAVRRLKALAETGEVPNTKRNPSGRSDAGEGPR
jgi:hypothetical protein